MFIQFALHIAGFSAVGWPKTNGLADRGGGWGEWLGPLVLVVLVGRWRLLLGHLVGLWAWNVGFGWGWLLCC